MLHEANHITQDIDHDDNEKDEFFLHGLGAILPDTLDANNEDHKHSSYQIEIEYLADLSQFPTWRVPLLVIGLAESTANSLFNNRIKNNPGWRVGMPRPL